MLDCITASCSLSSSCPTPSPHPPPSRGWCGPSSDGTPRSSGLLSPIDVHHEYAHALQSDSYKKIWTLFEDVGSIIPDDQELQFNRQESWERTRERIMAEALYPDCGRVREALGRAKRCRLTDLASSYFDESERATELFIALQLGVRKARAIYAPLFDLLSVLPFDAESLSEAQCRRAYEVFVQFDHCSSSFPFTGSDTFKPMRDCSLELKNHLTSRVRKSRSRVRLVHRATSKSGLCVIGTAAVVAVSAAAVTAHSLVVAAAAAPCIIPFLPPRKFVERELSRADQLNEAARVVYALSEHLETVDSLVERLQTTVEGDRRLIQIGLERGGDPGPIREVVKHLRRSPSAFSQQLEHLVVDTCLWFTTVNRARELLFEEICSHRDRTDDS
ncbi:UPF0496 protein At3g19250-like [Punica granatum]|uniref:UPF0496 protein At3g19250-like n=1 Tax=Punica granatum TaxID=22663 RepID=A0A6P8CF08_PUNGR|nr:UPF0496 protein At3g19250-like [Punica granatum]